MPGKSRQTGNTTNDAGYNNSSSQTKPNTQSSSSSRECKRFLSLYRFSFVKHLTRFSSLLFQRITRAVLFYDKEGKQVSISLQGNHLYISHYSGLRAILGSSDKCQLLMSSKRRVHISAVSLVSIVTVEFSSTGRVTNSSFYCIKHATQI